MWYMPWLFFIASIWLVAAPFFLGYQDAAVPMRNDIVVGAVMLIASAYWLFRHWKEHGWSFGFAKEAGRTSRTA